MRTAVHMNVLGRLYMLLSKLDFISETLDHEISHTFVIIVLFRGFASRSLLREASPSAEPTMLNIKKNDKKI